MRHDVTLSERMVCHTGEPRARYAAWREQLGVSEGLLLVDFSYTPYWLQDATAQRLTAIYCVSGSSVLVAVTDQPLVAESLSPREQFQSWLAHHHLVSFEASRPLQLEPVDIAKPWGQEIWYTGVEERGVCHFTDGAARSPIPWLQAVIPGGAAGPVEGPLVLLKILDPLPRPEQGELYFELHESKREAYVITHIDSQAWPQGVGALRYGFDPALVAAYNDEDLFRTRYLEAVLAYETPRRELDALSARGVSPNAELLADEKLLRARMNRFTHLRPVRVGDVVQVPPLLPHALQHGIRTIEFQTPSYERKILSFGQQVLTQPHWDTAEAVAQMQLLPAEQLTPVTLISTDEVLVEQIVDFPDFEVLRATIQSGGGWQLRCDRSYALVIVVTGILDLAGTHYASEQALLLPHFWLGQLAAPEAAPPLVLLLAKPLS